MLVICRNTRQYLLKRVCVANDVSVTLNKIDCVDMILYRNLMHCQKICTHL